MTLTRILMMLALTVVLVLAIGGEAQQTMKEMCQMCEQINSGSGSKSKYLCPAKKLKPGECSINLNGYCCVDSRKHATCKACFDDTPDEEDDDDDDI